MAATNYFSLYNGTAKKNQWVAEKLYLGKIKNKCFIVFVLLWEKQFQIWVGEWPLRPQAHPGKKNAIPLALLAPISDHRFCSCFFFFHPEGKKKTEKSYSGEVGRRSYVSAEKKKNYPPLGRLIVQKNWFCSQNANLYTK